MSFAEPGASAGVVAEIDSYELTMTPVAATPPIVTLALARKFVPLIVRAVPPPASPDLGFAEKGRRCESSEVLPPGSVAVTEIGDPEVTGLSVVTWRVTLPDPSVVTWLDPM